MYMALESEKIPLPSRDACVAYSTEARDAFGKGARPWKRVLQGPALALQHFATVAGADAVLWVAEHDWTDAESRPGSLVTLYFGTNAAASREQLGAFQAPLDATEAGWSADGIHHAPERAFPVLAVSRGQLFQLWVDDGAGNPYTITLRAHGTRVKRATVRFDDADAADFVPHVKHAVIAYDALPSAASAHREQLKLAFALQVAERVVEADGVVKEDERTFLRRSFPPDQVEALWLDDPALRASLARQAEDELRNLLGYHEKLALLSTFFAACYADGRLEVRELRVLKEASEALGLEQSDVVSYLQRLW